MAQGQEVRTYDPKEVLVIAGGAPIRGFADGTFITISMAAQAFTKTVGADGEVSRAKSNDFTAEVTITLKQTSPSNDVLMLIATADRLRNAGVVPLMIKDRNGRTLFVAPSAWIRQLPDGSYSREIEGREWVLDTAQAEYVAGGTPTTTPSALES